MNDSQRLTKSVTSKFTESDFQELRELAARELKRPAEWCRGKVLKALKPQSPRPSDYALMAEISATEAILIDLLCAIGRDGKLSQQKAQALVDAAHSAKYKEAAELLKYAYAQFQSGHLETSSDQATGSKR
ncbi:MAG TPA: hypothetical protein VGY31_14190 [Terriglobia bacterium]|nr:hypothetical protein [Terriglobia bacterium]